ncbi:unnamed protein product [Porites evermanni]|uniref:Uncharacterized protein n=1 Tax=Porites evermanni TaxID=104178 RepID=A0ABN8LM67_9CNID|nr:unnamed protein product [Porites evermanni]
MGGDFNLVMDVQKDKKGGKVTEHSNSLKEVQNKANSLDLVDGWRILNLDAERFTWRRTKPEGYKTDHSVITIHVANNHNPRGLGFWKLNTSFLLDSEYTELINKTVDEVAKECRNNDDVDAVLLWKMQI